MWAIRGPIRLAVIDPHGGSILDQHLDSPDVIDLPICDKVEGVSVRGIGPNGETELLEVSYGEKEVTLYLEP